MIDIILSFEDYAEAASTQTAQWREVVLVATGVFWNVRPRPGLVRVPATDLDHHLLVGYLALVE